MSHGKTAHGKCATGDIASIVIMQHDWVESKPRSDASLPFMWQWRLGCMGENKTLLCIAWAVEKQSCVTTIRIAVAMGTPISAWTGTAQTPVDRMVAGQWIYTGATGDERGDCILQGCSLLYVNLVDDDLLWCMHSSSGLYEVLFQPRTQWQVHTNRHICDKPLHRKWAPNKCMGPNWSLVVHFAWLLPKLNYCWSEHSLAKLYCNMWRQHGCTNWLAYSLWCLPFQAHTCSLLWFFVLERGWKYEVAVAGNRSSSKYCNPMALFIAVCFQKYKLPLFNWRD